MKKNDNSFLPWVLLTVPVLWLAAILAYGYEEGMTVFDLMGRFTVLVERPFSVRWTPYTLRFMLGALVAYAFAIVLYQSSKENRRPGEEHGSAKWGSARQLNAKYRDKDPVKNTILSQNVRMGLDGKKHRRNLLQIVIGGSGAGKTRFFVKPNLMQANSSFLVTDPKGEVLRAIAPLLIEKGYVIKVFDLIDPSHSDAFNPFPYIRDDKDAMKLVNSLIKNTTPKGAQQNDPFWEKSEIALDTALILHMEHGGGNNSTFTTRVVTSSGSDTYSTIAAAMSSLKGPKHGGANIKVMEMMADIRAHVRDRKDPEELAAYLSRIIDREAFDRKGLIYGMGHAVYSLSDPRERVFRGYVEELAHEKHREEDLQLYQAVEELAPRLIAQKRHIYKGVSPNVDFYSGFVYDMLGIPQELYTAMFAVARIVGWSAHRIEELICTDKIIRPAYMSVMEEKGLP